FFGVALGPPVFGLLMGLGRTVLFLSAAALAALVSAGAFFLIDEKRLSKKPAR
ncbi:MAG TPA: MFS transporter, partial [Clostridiales bacterium]|nr:MFS transporter [Clostridiales bacterium]